MKNSRIINLLLAFLLVILFCLPHYSDNFFITMMIRIMYYGLMAVAFTFLAGQLGLFSLMIPTAFGICGYTIAILESNDIIAFPLSPILGIGLALLISAFFGLLVNRSKGTYFLMLTLVLGQLVWAIILQWVSLTKGTNGISGIAPPKFLVSSTANSNTPFYYFVLAITLSCLFVLYKIINSSFGMKLRGIRESESRMIMLGHNVALLKWTAFMISAFISSLSGIFFVYFSGLVNPDSISLTASTQILISAIFGGVGSIGGAILGTGVIKTLEIVLSGFTQRYLLIIGVMFLLVIVFLPKGIMTIVGKAGRILKLNIR